MPKTEIDTIREHFAALEAAYVKADAELAVRNAGGNPMLLVPHLTAAGRARLNRNGRFDAEYLRGNSWLTSDEFIEHLRADETLKKAFVTKPTSGNRPKAPVGSNPFRKGASFNLTRQMAIERADPALAAKLKSEADAA